MNTAALKLENTVSREMNTPPPSMSQRILNERRFGKSVRTLIREFGEVLALVGVVVALFVLYKDRPLTNALAWFLAGFGLMGISRTIPVILYPAWRAWMGLAFVLERTTTPLILGTLWVVALLPTAVLMRVLGKSSIDLTFKSDAPTYWEERADKDGQDFGLLERQF